MKQIGLVLVAALIVVSGCKKEAENKPSTVEQKTAPTPTPTPVPEAPKPLVGQELANWYTACWGNFNDAKWDAFKGCYADGIKSNWVDSIMFPAPIMGIDGVVGMSQGFRTAFTDIKGEPQYVFVNGRTIIAINWLHGTNNGPMKSAMGEMPATNKPYGMMGMHIVNVGEDNKVTEEWWIQDEGTMMAQLGLSKNPGRPMMDKGLEGAPMIFVASDSEVEKSNLAAITKSNEAWGAGDLATSLGFLADTAIESDMTMAADVVGKKDIEKGWKMFRTAFPDQKMTVAKTWAAGDFVVTLSEFTGTNTGDMGKMKKTGKAVKATIAELAKLEGGKIAQSWRFYNGATFAMQMGMMPAPTATTAAVTTETAGEPSKADAKADAKTEAAPKKGTTKAEAGHN